MVSEIPTPNPLILVLGHDTICEGDSVLLKVAGNYSTYDWQPNGQLTDSIWVGQAGSYSVMVTASNGCEGNSDTVAIVQNPLPQVSIRESPGGKPLAKRYCGCFYRIFSGLATVGGKTNKRLYISHRVPVLRVGGNRIPTIV